jgi:hypothetical protein
MRVRRKASGVAETSCFSSLGPARVLAQNATDQSERRIEVRETWSDLPQTSFFALRNRVRGIRAGRITPPQAFEGSLTNQAHAVQLIFR